MKVLIAERGTFSTGDREQLAKLGFDVVYCHSIDGIKSASEVPLRDYFAAAAMQALVTRIGKHDTDLIAHDSYVMADAMLAEREKEAK